MCSPPHPAKYRSLHRSRLQMELYLVEIRALTPRLDRGMTHACWVQRLWRDGSNHLLCSWHICQGMRDLPQQHEALFISWSLASRVRAVLTLSHWSSASLAVRGLSQGHLPSVWYPPCRQPGYSDLWLLQLEVLQGRLDFTEVSNKTSTFFIGKDCLHY